MGSPKKWHQVYPYGTKQGDEEAKVFRALSRSGGKWTYRSVAALEKLTGLSRERLEEIIDKYATQFNPPLIYPHPNQDDHWGYWELLDSIKGPEKSISGSDKENRINKHLTGTSMIVGIDSVDSVDSVDSYDHSCDMIQGPCCCGAWH